MLNNWQMGLPAARELAKAFVEPIVTVTDGAGTSHQMYRTTLEGRPVLLPVDDDPLVQEVLRVVMEDGTPARKVQATPYYILVALVEE